MAHRVDPEIDIVRPEPQRLALRIERRHPVAVGEHRALGFTGRPGRVLEVAEVIHRAVDRPHGCRGRGKRFPHCRAGSTAASDADDMSKTRCILLHTCDHIGPLTIRNNRTGTGIADRVQQFLALVHDVCGDRHGADPPDCKIADQVLGRTVKVDADPVAFFYAKREKAAADPVHLVPEFFVRVYLVP